MRALAIVHESERDTGTIGERICERGFELEIMTVEGTLPEPGSVDLVVVYGSSESAYDDGVRWLRRELDYLGTVLGSGTPILGICFGGQVLSRVLGGSVAPSPHPETGWVTVATEQPALIAPGPWMQFHFDRFTLPPGATAVATSEHALQAFTHGPHLGLQFHPEITPEVFERWLAEWKVVGALEDFAAAGVDIAEIADEIVARAESSRAEAMRLFDAFWERSQRLVRPDEPPPVSAPLSG
jgi:GMP synthase (glutamine-hydrolysing)